MYHTLIEKRNNTELTETEHFIIEILEHRKDKLKLVELNRLNDIFDQIDNDEIDSQTAFAMLELLKKHDEI